MPEVIGMQEDDSGRCADVIRLRIMLSANAIANFTDNVYLI